MLENAERNNQLFVASRLVKTDKVSINGTRKKEQSGTDNGGLEVSCSSHISPLSDETNPSINKSLYSAASRFLNSQFLVRCIGCNAMKIEEFFLCSR